MSRLELTRWSSFAARRGGAPGGSLVLIAGPHAVIADEGLLAGGRVAAGVGR